MKRIHVLVASVVLAGAIPQGYAATVSITPDADNTLFEDAGGAVSGGALPNLYFGRTAQPRARRALIRFDVAGHVPAGATITSATLRINVNQTQSGGGQLAYVYRVTNAWGEGTSYIDGAGGGGAASSNQDATWIHTFYNTSFWNHAGGDYAPVESAFLPMSGAGAYTFSAAQIAADAQQWLDSPSNNFGWIIRANAEVSGNAFRFDSRESATASNRPTLTIGYDYTEPIQEAISGSRTTNGFRMTWSVTSGQVYSYDFITNLTINPQVWSNLSVVTAASSTLTFTDTNTPNRLGYYRLLKLEF
jgi:hypothetical protein